jgi:putative peptide zinc metalloprotease protein
VTPSPGTGTSALPEAAERPPAGSRGEGAVLDGEGRAQIPVLAEGLELLGEMPGSGHRHAPSLVRRADGQTIQLTPLLYAALAAIDGVRGYEDVAAEMGSAVGRLVTADDARFLIEQKLEPLGVLQRTDGSQPEVRKVNPLLALRPRVVLSNPTLTRRVTDPFAWLFQARIVVPVLVAFALISSWVLFEKGLASPARHAFDQPGLLLAVFALTIVSGGFHEFGHAAACRYGGARPGVMGFGLYLMWPAFYTDVSDAYRLGRWGRLRVDLGGLYFNAVFTVASFALWWVTRSDALLLLIPAQLLQMLRQLAPFIRADGYHILADLIGVPDLFFHIKPTLLSFLPTHWRRPETRTLRWWARLLVAAWVLIMVPLLVGVVVIGAVMLPRIAATAWESMGRQWGELVTALGTGELAVATIRVLSIIALVLPVACISYLLIRIGTRVFHRVKDVTEDRPALRGAAVVATCALAALLGFLWWPSGQYEPIRQDERGTIQEVLEPLTQLRVSPPDRGAGWLRPDARLYATASAQPQAMARPAIVFLPQEDSGDEHPAFIVLQPDPGERSEIRVLESPDGDELSSLPSPEAPSEEGAPEHDGTSSVESHGGGLPGPTSPEEADAVDDSWPFPFPPPPPPGEDDNRAMAVNTTDGSTVYDVAFALVWVTDDDVEHRNEAWALASCTDCTTVAVAFEVVLVVGHAEIVTPVNIAAAANYECDTCVTWAIAVQLVATLTGEPGDDVIAQIDEVWARVQAFGEELTSQPIENIHPQLKAFEAEILRILTADGDTHTAHGDEVSVAGAEEHHSTSTTEQSTTTTTWADSTDTTTSTTTSTTEEPTTTTTTWADSTDTTTSSTTSTTEEPTTTTTWEEPTVTEESTTTTTSSETTTTTEGTGDGTG